VRIWRISSHADLSGRGGELSAARWNRLGTPIVYCADHPAAALLEILVHIDTEDAPATYQLLGIHVPDETPIFRPPLPDNWKENLSMTQDIGTRFISEGRHAVMAVPSVIVPFATNYLLNPARLEQASIGINSRTEHPIDPRLIA
jgi:RES domain-containing protein